MFIFWKFLETWRNLKKIWRERKEKKKKRRAHGRPCAWPCAWSCAILIYIWRDDQRRQAFIILNSRNFQEQNKGGEGENLRPIRPRKREREDQKSCPKNLFLIVVPLIQGSSTTWYNCFGR